MPTKLLGTCAALAVSVTLVAGGRGPVEDAVTVRPLIDQQQQTPLPTPPPQQQQSEIDVSLTASGYQPKLGVPDFLVQGGDAKLREVAATLADTLWNDLDFEKEFWLIDRKSSSKIAPAATAAAIDFDGWTALGADFVVLGVVRPTTAGFDVDLQVIRVRGSNRGRRDHGQTYGPCTVANVRFCAHFMADDMHAKLRQLDGVARTKLAFTSDRAATRMTNRRVENSGDAKEIYIADYDGANQTRVTANQSLNISPVWGPDTRTLAYISYTTGFPDLYLTAFDGRAPTRPAKGSASIQNYQAAISPDGQKIAYVSSRAGSFDIWVMNRNGSGMQNLTAANPKSAEGSPSWSPTGDQIAFTSDRTGLPGIYIMRADGFGQERIYGAQHADRPTWSKLNFIAFTINGAGSKDIAMFDIRDRSVRIITDGRGVNESPAVAPNGRHIAFVTSRWGKEQIAVIGIDGKNLKRITEAGNNGWPSWSPSPK